MECNRCFTTVVAIKPLLLEQEKRKRRRLTLRPGKRPDDAMPAPDIINLSTTEQYKEAWECCRCRLVVCEACRKKYDMVAELD